MLNVTQEQLQQLLDGMNVGFILLDQRFHVIKLNTECLRIDGRRGSEIIGETCWDAWPDMASAEIGRVTRASMADRKTRTVNPRFARAGREAWLEMRIHPWGDGLALFLRDVTERRHAQSELRATQEQYRLAARATNDILWDWDVIADEVRWNEAASLFMGAPVGPPDLPSQWWKDRLHAEDKERVVASLTTALEDGSTYWSDEYRLRQKGDNYAIIYDRGFIIRGEGGQAIRAVGAMVDVTEMRMAEQKVQQLQSQLIHVSRVSAMGTMASTLAHELNQPLTAVTSYVSGCQRLIEGREDGDMERLRGGLKGARESALRAGDVIRRLRAMTERGEVLRKHVKLVEAVEEAAALALVGISDGVAATVDVAADLVVEADPIQLQQVVLNLIRNALDAMEAAPRKALAIVAARKGKTIRIEVSDTGGGIADDVKDSLFEPFISTREAGMGIGLSISRTIVEAHQGKIWAEDNDAGGTTFCVTLPAAAAPRRKP